MTKKLPTLLGLFLVGVLVFGLALATRAVSRVTTIFSRAQADLEPAGVGTANVTDTSFGVFWTTDLSTTGAVFYGRSEALSDGAAVDDRDLSGNAGKYSTHFVRVSGLKPATKYFFKVATDGVNFGDKTSGGQAFFVTTGRVLLQGPKVEPIFGKVLDASGSPLAGIVVTWEGAGAGKIAAMSKSDGSYVLAVGNARDLSGDNYVSFSSGAAETVTLDGGVSGVARISCQWGTDRPLPTVRLGETVDCLRKTGGKAAGLGFKTGVLPAGVATGSGTLTVNLSEGEKVSSTIPTFSGKAGANQIVQVTVQSPEVLSGTVKADSSGNWSWTPPVALSPGRHTVTITIVNADGTKQTVVRNFTVSGDSPILPITSGTPSAQPQHFACVNKACVEVAGGEADTCAFDSDCTTTGALPTPPPAPPPESGATENTLLLLGLGVGALVIAILATIFL